MLTDANSDIDQLLHFNNWYEIRMYCGIRKVLRNTNVFQVVPQDISNWGPQNRRSLCFGSQRDRMVLVQFSTQSKEFNTMNLTPQTLRTFVSLRTHTKFGHNPRYLLDLQSGSFDLRTNDEVVQGFAKKS